MKLDNVKSGFNLETINENFQKLEDVINDEVMFRKPPVDQPNHLETDVDMNGKRIYNSAYPEHPLDIVRLVDLKSITGSGGGTASGVTVNTNKGLPGPTAQDAFDATWDKLNVAYYESARAYSIASGQRIAIAELEARVDGLTGQGGNSGTTDSITYRVGGRVLSEVLDDLYVNVKDYGALGDGFTDDTDAIQEAYATAYELKKKLYFPAGTFMVSGLIFNNTYLTSFTVEGAGWGITTIKAIDNTVTPVLTLSHPSDVNTIGPNEMTFKGIHFKGNYPDYKVGVGNYTEAAVHMSSGFVMSFEDCWFSHARTAFYNYRGVLDRFTRCQFTNSEIGFRALHSFGTTSHLISCDAKNNFLFGLHLDEQRQIVFNNGSIENNGTVGDPGTAGVFVGSQLGAGGQAQTGRGLTLRDSWVEYNHGKTALWFTGGVNTVMGCLFSYHDASVGALIHVSGGMYRVIDNVFEADRIAHIMEERIGTVKLGNVLVDNIVSSTSKPINVNVDPVKTLVSRGLDKNKINWNQDTGFIEMKERAHFTKQLRLDGAWTEGTALAVAGYIPITINGNEFRLAVHRP